MIQIFVVDDHRLFRTGLVSMLKTAADLEIVGEASTGMEAVQWVRNHSVDVILMDLNLPEMSGLEATRRIVLSSPQVKILVLTAHRDIIYPFRLLRAGALGYLTKDSDPDTLIEAIRQVANGNNYLPSPLAKLLADRRFAKNNDFPFDGLSDRELDVMLMLIDGKGTVEISRELRLGVSTVNCYRHRILKQLNVKNVVDLVHMAQKYRLIDPFK